MRAALLVSLFALSLAGCSNSSSIGVGASTGTSVSGYYGSHYGAYPWWYDDYFYYWDYYYPWCCDNEGDFDELIKKWWNGLDEERQQEIKDKFQNWQENRGEADLAALRGDFAARWNAMSPEQRDALRENSQKRPSVSNPDRTPRSPLDYKAATQPRIDRALEPGTLPRADGGLLIPSTLPKTDGGVQTPGTLPKNDGGALTPGTLPRADGGALTPGTLPRADGGVLTPGILPRVDGGTLTPGTLPKTNNGILTPGAQPKVDARPHLPRSMATPVHTPTVRPTIRPGFTPMRSFGGGGRRR